jgi:DNA-binding response OmpR family regulator
MMPVMDGIELTESLKRDPKTQHIPVIMLSARDQIREEMEARGFVADAYMSKPFSTRALGKLARATVRVSPRSTQSSAV